MNLPLKISKVTSQLLARGASSVFVYGSRARGDNLVDSDWEIGALFTGDDYATRSELAGLQTEKVVIYPFRLDELKAGIASTPFTNSIWLNEVIIAAKTIGGDDLIGKLVKPEITDIDVLVDSAFYKARALDAMIAQREGYQDLARDLFVKSVLLGSRALLLASNHSFPESYTSIARDAARLVGEEYGYLLNRALEVRANTLDVSVNEVFDNIGLQMDIEHTARRQLSTF